MMIEGRDKGNTRCIEGIRFRGLWQGRNQFSRKKARKESGFRNEETGFVQLRCEYGTIVMKRNIEHSGCVHSLVSSRCIMERVSLGNDGRKTCI